MNTPSGSFSGRFGVSGSGRLDPLECIAMLGNGGGSILKCHHRLALLPLKLMLLLGVLFTP